MMMYSPTGILLLCAHHTCQKVIAMNQRYPFSRKECRWWYLWCVVPLFLLNSEFESKPDCRLGKQFYMVVWDIGMVSWCVRCWLFVGSLVHSFSSSSCGERFIFKMSKCLTRLKMSPTNWVALYRRYYMTHDIWHMTQSNTARSIVLVTVSIIYHIVCQ